MRGTSRWRDQGTTAAAGKKKNKPMVVSPRSQIKLFRNDQSGCLCFASKARKGSAGWKKAQILIVLWIAHSWSTDYNCQSENHNCLTSSRLWGSSLIPFQHSYWSFKFIKNAIYSYYTCVVSSTFIYHLYFFWSQQNFQNTLTDVLNTNKLRYKPMYT